MDTIDTYNLILKVASALLIQNREISVDEIRAFPFVDTESVEIIKQTLLSLFDADIHQRKKSDSVIPQWEEVVVLREKRIS